MNKKLTACLRKSTMLIGLSAVIAFILVMGGCSASETDTAEPTPTNEIVDVSPTPEIVDENEKLIEEIKEKESSTQEVNEPVTTKKPSQLPVTGSTATEKPAVTPTPTQKPVDVPTHTHNYTVAETVYQSCYEEGYKLFKCSCGDSYKEVLPSYGGLHDAVQTGYVAPTYTEQGYTEYTCNRCGDVMRSWIDKLVDENTATPEPTPTPDVTPEPPSTEKCGTCGQTGHSILNCTNAMTSICSKCGVDKSKVQHWYSPADFVCPVCGNTIPAWTCHSH